MSTELLVAATQAELESDIETADQGAPAGTVIEIELAADITLNHELDALNLPAGDSLVINGQGHALDGAGMYRGLFAYAGTTTIENLAVNDMRAQGGAGGLGGAGGGAGLGGGLFVAAGANVSLSGVAFKADQAVGGQGGAIDSTTSNGITYGGDGGGGGGGLGGSGGPAEAIFGSVANGYLGKAFAGGGGGVGLSAFGGSYTAAPGAGLVAGAGAAGAGTSGAGSSAGGANGGGGGGAGAYFPPNLHGGFGFGGGGGVGGTSGGNEAYVSGTGASGYRPAAGNGGFGGGGGGGGSGGFGGGGGGDAGGVAGSSLGSGAGWGAGNGDAGYGISTGTGGGFGGGGGGQLGFGPDNDISSGINYGGGGGLGAGGDIFVQQGGQLTIGAGSLSNGGVTGGQGADGAQSGQAFGAGIFGEGSETISLEPAAGQQLTVGDVIADQNGSYSPVYSGNGGNGNPADNSFGALALDIDGAGTVVLAADNTFSGGLTMTSGVLDLTGIGAAGAGNIAFAAPLSATLEFAASVTPTERITGFGQGDTIQVDGLIVTGHSYDGTMLTLDGTGGPVHIAIPDVTAQNFVFSQNGTATEVTVACFAHGTCLATERGWIGVEDLSPGDNVLTLEGSLPVIWIGMRDVRCDRHPMPDKVNPVRILAHAFGHDQPARDLFLSPDHAVFTEGVLIPIRYLINGGTVRQMAVANIRYYHVELPVHAVVLAEGLRTESYFDTGDRYAFGHSTVTDLHPAWGAEARDIQLLMDAKGYAPLCVTGLPVDRVRRRLASRAHPVMTHATA